MNTEFITIKELADDIYSRSMMRDLPFERIIRNTVELTQIVGCPMLFETREVVLEVDKWRAALPCDYYSINQINLLSPDGRHVAVFKKSTGTFSPVGSPRGADLVYQIKGRILYSSVPKCKIAVSYEAMKLDEDGFPMLINNASFLRALKSYIKMDWYTDMYDEGRIKLDVLQNAQKEYYFNISQAQISFVMPDIAGMENIALIMNDAFTRQHEYYNNFNDLNKKHKLRIH